MANNLPNYQFEVQINDNRISCQGVRNVAMGTEVIEKRSSSSPATFNSKEIGRDFFENIFIERPVTKNDNFFFEFWRSNQRATETNNNQEPGVSMSIRLLDKERNPVIIWQVAEVIPIRLSYSDLDSMGNGLLMETLELSCGIINVELP